jgi:hypothetical protein
LNVRVSGGWIGVAKEALDRADTPGTFVNAHRGGMPYGVAVNHALLETDDLRELLTQHVEVVTAEYSAAHRIGNYHEKTWRYQMLPVYSRDLVDDAMTFEHRGRDPDSLLSM